MRSSSRFHGNDRRASIRYPIERDIVFTFEGRKSSPDPLCGKTINLSSGGVLFSTEAPVCPGKMLEVSISWPIKLDGMCGLKLVTRGRVVRSDSKSAAIEVERYEFRTRSVKGLSIRSDLQQVSVVQGAHKGVLFARE
jgi:hypothetical protein